jgi:hypothetical protein
MSGGWSRNTYGLPCAINLGKKFTQKKKTPTQNNSDFINAPFRKVFFKFLKAA